MRRLVGFPLVLVLVGCSSNSAPPPEPAGEARAAPLPEVGDASVIRVGKGEAPAEPPPKPPEPGTLTLPAGGGAWPWNLAAAPTPNQTVPVPLDVPKGRVTGVAVAPAAKRAVVTVGPASSGTRVFLCDLAAGTVAAEWEVREKYDILDLSPDGKQILLQWGQGEPRDVLFLWTISADLKLKRAQWQPHENRKRELFGAIGTSIGGGAAAEDARKKRSVAWAAFSGTDRIVTSSAEGQLRVWDAAKLERLGSIDAAPGNPALSPDGTRVAFLAPQGVALLDPAAAKVVASRAFGVPPGDRVLAFSPDGRMLACAGAGRVAFLDLATGEKWDAVGQKLSANPDGVPRTFGWLGNSHVLAEQGVFDTDLPLPLWKYTGWDACAFRGRELWVVTGKDAGAAVVGFILPHAGLVEALEQKKATPGVFALRAGDSVRIDVSGLPADKQAEASAALERRLRQVGYVPNPSATAVLSATEDRTGTPYSTEYLNGSVLKYDARYARLKLAAGGKTLWEDRRTFGGPMTWPAKKSAATVIEEYGVGRPNYSLFADARIPTTFPGQSFPDLGFGVTRLTPAGLTGDSRPRD